MSGTVAVLGAGTMGAGIAQACAAAGHRVLLHDISDEARQRGVAAVRSSLERFVSRGKLEQAGAEAVLARPQPVRDRGRRGDAEGGSEGRPENRELTGAGWRVAGAA